MKIDLHYGMDPSFGPSTHEHDGVGGTENFVTYTAEYLARAGHRVRVYNKVQRETVCSTTVPLYTGYDNDEMGGYLRRWVWYPLERFNSDEGRDVLMSFRTREIFDQSPNARLKVLALADTESHGLGEAVRAGLVDRIIFVSCWQANKIATEEGIPIGNCLVSSNGVAMERFDELRNKVERVPGKCIHLATPERGLEPLLDIWPAIQARVPHANLHLFSSFRGWRVIEADNEAMCRDIYARIESMREAGMNITNHKHAGAAEIRRHLLESELYLYPTRHFNETCCISALEASAAGVPIVATSRAALIERVENFRTGYLINEGPGHDELFAEMAVQLLEQKILWRYTSELSVEMAREYDYVRLVEDWERRWACNFPAIPRDFAAALGREALG